MGNFVQLQSRFKSILRPIEASQRGKFCGKLPASLTSAATSTATATATVNAASSRMNAKWMCVTMTRRMWEPEWGWGWGCCQVVSTMRMWWSPFTAASHLLYFYSPCLLGWLCAFHLTLFCNNFAGRQDEWGRQEGGGETCGSHRKRPKQTVNMFAYSVPPSTSSPPIPACSTCSSFHCPLPCLLHLHPIRCCPSSFRFNLTPA